MSLEGPRRTKGFPHNVHIVVASLQCELFQIFSMIKKKVEEFIILLAAFLQCVWAVLAKHCVESCRGQDRTRCPEPRVPEDKDNLSGFWEPLEATGSRVYPGCL